MLWSRFGFHWPVDERQMLRISRAPIHRTESVITRALEKGLAMSSQDTTQVAREILTAYSTGNWTALKGLLAPTAIYNELGSQRRIQGADSIVQALQGWKKAMTDSQGKVTNAFASGDTVAMQITWTGTHDGTFTGPAGSIPATGKKQTTQAAMIVKFSGNKVSEIHHYFDMITFLSQIGAMPSMART